MIPTSSIGFDRGWMSTFLALCVGCATQSAYVSDTNRIVGDGEIRGTRTTAGASPIVASSGSSASSEAAPPSGNGSIASGVMTAAVWDDNENFDLFLGYKRQVVASGIQGLLPFTMAEHEAAAHATDGSAVPKQSLDISLVIDTTGSMGDELGYLQREFDALAATIQTKYPDAEQRWSLVVYKDTTDQYIARWFDFRSNSEEFRTKLAEQSADGGGDFPEAPDRALSVAYRLSWRTSPSVAKLIFWVADAPHHEENAAPMADAIRGARDKGIHVYPVASSGIDEKTELSMREAAQITGGRYLFLTDDSGIGHSHKEASVPCYVVTKLDKAILRIVDIEMTGVYREAVADEVIRTVGDPQKRACNLASGGTAVLY